jgi:hypothetical protein
MHIAQVRRNRQPPSRNFHSESRNLRY